MPVRQLVGRANLPALAHDHHYLEQSMEADFLEKIRVSQITESMGGSRH